MKDTKYCFKCGAEIDIAAEICVKCGVRQPLIAKRGTSKSKITAGLLGIFLGGLGVHKFYLGRIGLGMLYLLSFWTFIPAIVGLIEGIVYLGMSDENFDIKYNS